MATNKQIIEFQGKGIAKLKSQYKELEKRTRRLEGATNRASKGLGGMVAALGLTTAALYAATRAISSTIRVGANFEKTMSNVAAISGATSEQMKALEKNAKDLGSTTVFTASQVGALQVEFAKLGFTTDQIQGVTKDTLALASATGSDLATSAAVAGGTLRAFGMDVADTARVTDTMALSFSSSALDMEKFQNSMQYVGPIAKAAGIDVEGATAMLGTLANNMISGSMAGTSLRKILLEAGREGSKLAKRMGGPVRSMDDFQKGLKKLKTEGFDVMADGADLVGARAVTAFGILVDGAKSTDELNEALQKAAGSAQNMADIQLDNLQGKATLLGSAMEGLGISIFEHLAPSLNNTVEGMTNLVNSMNSYLQIPLSEKLMAERDEYNILMGILTDTNVSQDTRNKTIAELQKNYPNYIGNIDLEAASTEQLRGILKQSNDEYERQIELEATREILAEQRKEEVKLQRQIFETEKDLRKERENSGKSVDFSVMGPMFKLENSLRVQKERLQEVRAENAKFIESLNDSQKTLVDNSNAVTKFGEQANNAFTGLGGGDDTNRKDITKTQLADYQQFLNERAALFGEDTERQMDLLVDQTNKMTELYDQQGLDVNDIIEFYTEKRRQILEDDGRRTVEVYNKIASGFSSFLGEFAGGQKAAARIQQASALVDAYSTANALMADPKLVAAYPLNIVSAASALATGLANVMAISKSIGEFKTAATGFDGVVTEPTMFLTGEAGPESVQVTPLTAGMNKNGPQGQGITLNITAPLVDETVVEAIIPALEKANRMNLA